jgi:membrane protease YdiL (CAAX protease family)
MHPIDLFYNRAEGRLPAFWRITAHFILILAFVLGYGQLMDLLPVSVFTGFLNELNPVVSFTLATWLAARYLDKRAFRAFGLTPDRNWWREFGIGIAAAFTAFALIFIIFRLLGWIDFTGYGWERAGSRPFLLAIGGYVLKMMAVGYYEELMSRGYHLTNMVEGFTFGGQAGRRRAIALALFTSSLLFGLLHAGNPNFTPASLAGILLAGVVLGLPYLMTGRLGFAIGLHFAWNFVQGGVFGFPVSGMPFRESLIQHRVTGPDWLTGGAFGPEAGLIPLVILAMIGAISIRIIADSNQPPTANP